MKVAITVLLALGSFVVAMPRARAQIAVYANIPGQPIDSMDVFYDQLAPYGTWVEDPEYGALWMPDQADYVPYTNGHWEYSDVGMVWVSDVPFASITSHYGRWFYSDVYGRWVWMPGTQWGPSWVDWYESGDEFGWAPMPPQIIIDQGYSYPWFAWHYAPAKRLFDPDLHRWYARRDRIEDLRRRSRPLQRWGNYDGRNIVVGPAPDVLRNHRVNVQPRRIDPRRMGRMNPGEYRSAIDRARQQRPRVEQDQQRRFQANPALRGRTQVRPLQPQAMQQRQPRQPRQPTQQRQPSQQRQPRQMPPRPRQMQPQPRQMQPQPPRRQMRPQPPQPRAVQPQVQPRPMPPQQAQPRVQPRPMQPRQIQPRVQPRPMPPRQMQPQPRAVQPRVEPQPQARPRPTEPQPQARPRPTEPQPRVQPRVVQPRQAPPAPRANAHPAPRAQQQPAQREQPAQNNRGKDHRKDQNH